MASHTLDRSTASHRLKRVRPGAVLTVVLVAALAINIETTIVNVALPTLNSSLDASTRGLQWIVDAYNLAFAALVLAGGTIGDKFGRRRTLIAGLVLFAAASIGAALCTTTGELIAMRIVMGVASAMIYPTTLAIITDTFRDPRQRAAAIGLWGAVTGLGVAIGPILGGALLEVFWWGSLFLALAPIALAAAVAAPLVIPAAKADASSRLDRGGLLLSVVMLAALVYTIIRHPSAGGHRFRLSPASPWRSSPPSPSRSGNVASPNRSSTSASSPTCASARPAERSPWHSSHCSASSS